MIKKIAIGGTAAGLVLAGAASAAKLDTNAVAGKTLAAGDVTVSGAVLQDISFGTAWTQDFSTGTDGLIVNGIGRISNKDGVGTVNGSVFTRFGGYTTTSAGTWKASVDVYLDPTADTQFEYSVAANNAGGHVQDFIFHAANTSDGLTVGASNNAGFKPNTSITGYKIPAAGWYTLQHEFRADADENLAVTMTVVDESGKTVFTHSGTALQGGVAGQTVVFAQTGHRYGWFTFTSGDLKVDNMSLTSAEPQSKVETITVDIDKPSSWVVASFDGFTSKEIQTNEAGIAVIDIPTTPVGGFTGPIHLVVTS